MWLVVGGPLLVVVASIITAVIAVKGADPVLDKEDYERNLQAARSLQGQARIDALIQLQPAHQARNHAASPVVPTDE
ncbi:nitrogen fixation protein FixH [Hydrogenophaga taeniospiralis]|nr:nitrogen fixation protein FixH [Hydrogenophaga taeniospiralis]